MNASHLRWTELKRKGPWQAPAEEDSSEKLDIVIGDSASSLPTAENDEDDSAVDDEGALSGFFVSNGISSVLICHARYEWSRESECEGR
jgi:hypothetical protein